MQSVSSPLNLRGNLLIQLAKIYLSKKHISRLNVILFEAKITHVRNITCSGLVSMFMMNLAHERKFNETVTTKKNHMMEDFSLLKAGICRNS